jgi:hypothetical protein
MPFKIQNVEKKDVSDKSFWMKKLKNGKKIYLEEETYYRWGYAIVEEDPREHGWSEGDALLANDFNLIDWHLEDGCWSERYGIDDLSKKEKELIEENFFLDDAGWESYDSELTFFGPVEITEVDE